MFCPKKAILVLGGAGYIGSHSSYLLSQLGYEVIIVDKLLHGQTFNHSWAKLIKTDFANEEILNIIFDKFEIEAVMHFAALIEVGESVKRPADFYENNVIKTLKFLNLMLKKNVKNFIFSSSCAVYGDPIKIPMDENHPKNPVSPYGKNKLAVEYALQDYAHAYGLKYVSLRYFNASGALPEQNLGEQHNPETHIIPLMLRAIKNKKKFKIFGTDYDSVDGTCVRDYIHVLDIAHAHILALQYLNDRNNSDCFNLGTGNGLTVGQMINAAEKITAQKLITKNYPRRAGDSTALVADYSKAKKVLGWEPENSDINFILKTAWQWENEALNGLKAVVSARNSSKPTLLR
ncbi:MAG: UDP-glucose 4-epimerase GalE [bacterium]